MRFAKKAIMVPEDEYMALLNMLKSGDYRKNEKASIEGKLVQNLADPKISQTVKSKRHDWLFKKRRQLKEIEENRPQKVTIENVEQVANLAPYLGIKKPKTSVETEQPIPQKRVRIRTPRKKQQKESVTNGDQESSQQSYTSSGGEYSSETEGSEYKTPPKKINLLSAKHRTSPKNLNKIANIINKNPEKYGIDKSGQVFTNFGSTVKGSNFMDSLKYVSGQLQTPPKGFKFFLQKINKDPEIAKLFTLPQEGKGRKKRRVAVKLKPIKTPGLKRIAPFNVAKKFKPIIWAKL